MQDSIEEDNQPNPSKEEIPNSAAILQRLDKITSLLETVLSRLDHLETENESLKRITKNCVDREEFNKLQQQVDDLSNRSRRNNIVVWGIPEGSEENPSECADFVSDFLKNHMKVPDGDEIEIERAHRSPAGRLAKPQQISRKYPRPIHVKLLRFKDRDNLLRNAGKYLKDNNFKGSRINISDDVTKSVREDRKKLTEIRNVLRKQSKFALIPWTIPACLLIKTERGGSLKRVSLDELKQTDLSKCV